MSSSKKHHSNRSHLLFDCLPPRVIIHEILEYYLLWIPFNSTRGQLKPYSLFGYFKKDRLRNLWFVFSSIYLRRSFFKKEHLLIMEINKPQYPYLDLRRTTFLRFDPNTTDDERLRNFLKKLTTMNPGNTNRMRVVELYDRSRETPNILKNDLTFPYLTKLVYSYSGNMGIEDSEEEYSFLKNWNNLDWSKFSHFRSLKLDLDQRKVIPSLDFLSNNLPLSNMLTSLVLREVYVKQPLEAKFTKLQKLEISYCKNILIDITPGDCLVDLCYKDYDGLSTPTLKKILLCRPTKLNSISFMFGLSNFEPYSQLMETYFDTDHFSKSLRKLSLDLFSSHDTLGRIHRIVENMSLLKEIRIDDLGDLSKDFFETWKFPQLSRLHYSFGNVGTLNCSFSETLKVLEFEYVSDLSDDFFSKNQWNNLESLKLNYCRSIEGRKDWRVMKKLRSLKIDHCRNFVDDFFQKDGNIHKNIPCLEKLLLDCFGMNKLEGKDWNLNPRFENLKILSIRDTILIGDELFQGKLEFSKLEELTLIDMDNIHGTNWKNIYKMENLRMFVLRKCSMNRNKEVLERIFKERGVIVENEEKEL